MWPASLLIAVLCAASAASAQCQPSGRKTFAAGVEALDRGDLTAAAASFDALVQSQPNCAEARNNLAVVLVEQGHLREAVEQLRRAVALQSDYHRARLNLERVETLLAARPATTPPAKPVIEVEPPRIAEPTPARAPEPTPAAAAASVPSSIAALEPAGATACVIEPAQGRVCVYRRVGDDVSRVACYAFLSARLDAAMRWLTASDLTPQRIRLVDETGRKRLKIVGENAAAGADFVRLRAADFNALSALVVPWRIGWVVSDEARVARLDTGAIVADVRSTLERWRQAWERQQFEAYTALYSAAFIPQGGPDVAHWKARKRQLFEQGGAISVEVRAPSLFVLDDATVIATFEQRYRAPANASLAVKAMRWRREGDRWTISAETVLNETRQP